MLRCIVMAALLCVASPAMAQRFQGPWNVHAQQRPSAGTSVIGGRPSAGLLRLRFGALCRPARAAMESSGELAAAVISNAHADLRRVSHRPLRTTIRQQCALRTW